MQPVTSVGGHGKGAGTDEESRQHALARARLAAIVTSCPDPIVGETLDGIITDWNPAAERLYGYSAAEAIGQSIAIILPRDRRDELHGLLDVVRRGEQIAGFETVRRAKDGRLIDVSLTVFPIVNDCGEIIGASATTRDISSRKAAQAELTAAHQQSQTMLERISRLSDELRASEGKYRALVEQLPAVVYLTAADPQETPLYFSPYIEALIGFSPDEALQREPGVSWLDYVHPDDRAHVAELDALADHGDHHFRAEYRTRRRDGSYIWVRNDCIPIYDDDGAIVAWQGVIVDISDRIEAEAAQARLAAIVEGAEDAIVSRTLDGTITSWNHGAEQLYGWSAAEMIGQSFARILPEPGAFDAQAPPEEFGEQPKRYEAKRRRADGTLIDVAISLSPIRDRGGAIVGVSSITRDITERKRADEMLRVALEEAHAATRAKTRFLAMLSHELRTPLQAVLGYADFLLNAPDQTLRADQREDIGFIHQSARRMATLIEQMLDLSRMEAGRLELDIDDVDVARIVEQVRQDVAPLAEAKGLALSIAISPALPPVRGDAGRLRQVLLNLAGNAVKFTERGEVRVSAEPARDGGIDVAVSDTGIGIAADDLSRIFEEFQQIDSAATRRHGGAGLGLAIARGLADQLGGQINVTSTPGVGSTFTLHIRGDG